MKTGPKVLLIVGGVIAVVALVAVGVAAGLLRRAFPSYRGVERVTGISADVEILRDEFGVPHVWAETSQDLYFAQGYVHAQDRFWQMEFSRRIGSGRLSEVLGSAALDNDRFLRTMGFERVARAEYAALPAEEKSWIDAYAAGVNAYIDSRKTPNRLAIEFALLGLTGVDVAVEPWTVTNTLTWGKVMALSLGGNHNEELFNLDLIRFGGSALRDIVRPPYRIDMPFIISDEEIAAYRTAQGLPPIETRVENPAYALRTVGNVLGSNSWVVGPELSETGAPLLANDMHLAVQMPSIWYEIALHLSPPEGGDEEPMNVHGFSFPGVPGVIAGQNDSIAWGITNLGGDVQDLHVVSVDPEQPNRYERDGEWQEMAIRHESIIVADRDEPEYHRVRETHRGPIITDLPMYGEWFAYDVAEESGVPSASFRELALHWTALTPSFTVGAVFAYNRATSYDEFRDALIRWGSPGQNFVFAAADGTIAYHSTGLHPNRDPRLGQLPTDRDPPERNVSFGDLPAVVDPAKGYIVTANNPVVSPAQPYPMGVDFANGKRAKRIAQLIDESGAGIDMERMVQIQADRYSIAASEVVPHLLDVDIAAAYERRRVIGRMYDATAQTPGVGESDEAETVEDRDRDIAVISQAIDILADWDFVLDTDSNAAAIYGYVWKRLLEEAFADEVPRYRWPLDSPGGFEDAVHALLSDPTHWVWDDARTGAVTENAGQILGSGVVNGVLDMRRDHGDDIDTVTWGDVHTIEFRNQSLGESGVSLVERILNRGPFPVPGGPTTVNVAPWNLDEPFAVRSSASQRAVYDLSNPSASVFIHTTGQSGHPFHRHYDDMIERWIEAEYHPSYWTYEEARKAAGNRRLILKPESD